MIEYDRVIAADGRQVFGEVPGECFMWCFKKEHRDLNLTVIVGRTGEKQSIQDYLYKVA